MASTMSAINASMSTTPALVPGGGVKGSDVYTTTGADLLDLSVMLNRGLSKESINAAVAKVLASGSKQDLEDLIVLTFQTRDVRGGKGERDLFYHLYTALQSNTASQQPTQATLSLVPEYGYWADLFTEGMPVDKVARIAKAQLEQDEAALKAHASASEGTPAPSLSLLAKWLPREHSNKASEQAKARYLAHAFAPGDKKAHEHYRKRVAAVNKALQTMEITMCGKNFSALEPAKVPGRALKQYTKALLNQPVKGVHGRKVPSVDPDRVQCAERFTAHFSRAAKGEAKVHGAHTVYPHELVAKVMGYNCILSTEEQDALEAQWRSIVDDLRTQGTRLQRSLAMCDFSGSMGGTPMYVSMALGLIIAELNTGLFKDCILTFDSTPTLHRFKSTGLVNRVREVQHLAQGTSTDFQAAYNLVLKTMVDGACPAGEEPTDLIVLTDMGWDDACGANFHYGHRHAVKTKDVETHLQIARRAFVKQGELLWGDGKGWAAPRCIVWNLRAEYKDFHATANEAGVLNVAGWSPSLLKVLATQGMDAVTPAAMLRVQLDDPRYEPVREAIRPWTRAGEPETDEEARTAVRTYWGV